MTFSQWWVARIHEYQDEGFEERIVSGPYHSKEDAEESRISLAESDAYGHRLQIVRNDFMAVLEDE